MRTTWRVIWEHREGTVGLSQDSFGKMSSGESKNSVEGEEERKLSSREEEHDGQGKA